MSKALDNLMFLKQQQWRVINYALTAYAALFAVAALVRAKPPEMWIFVAAVVLVLVFSLLILQSFSAAFEKFRARVQWIYNEYFTEEQIDRLRLRDEKSFFDQKGFLFCLRLISAGGAMFAIIAIALASRPFPGLAPIN